MKKLLILLIPLLLTGCYDYKDLNELAIVSAIAIDKIDDQYNISIQAINAKKAENIKPKFYVYSVQGKSVQDAINNLINDTSINTYFNHIDVLLIDEEIAKDSINDILDYFYRSTNIRVEFLPIICNGYKCKDIIKLQTTLEDLNSKDIKFLIENDKIYLGTVNDISFSEMLNDYINPLNDIALPSVTLTGTDIDTEKTDVTSYVKTTNMGYFKDDKFVEYLDKNKSISYNFIENNISNLIMTIPCGNNYYSVDLIDSKTSTSYKNSTISINIKANGNLTEINCGIDLTKEKNIEFLNKMTEEYIKKSIYETIDYLNSKDVDILKFKDLIYKTDSNYFKHNLKSLNDIKYKVKVNMNIESTENGIKEINDEKTVK